MIVLSLDPGIKNLAYGLFDVASGTWRVIDWNVLPLAETSQLCKKVSLGSLCETLLQSLDDTFDSSEMIDLVLIENQPVMKNPVMKSIQIMLFTYFHLRRMHEGTIGEIRFVSARTKNTWASACNALPAEQVQALEQVTSEYRKNKKQSVAVVRALLEHCVSPIIECSEAFRDTFLKSKKKDDLADAWLQAWAILN